MEICLLSFSPFKVISIFCFQHFVFNALRCVFRCSYLLIICWTSCILRLLCFHSFWSLALFLKIYFLFHFLSTLILELQLQNYNRAKRRNSSLSLCPKYFCFFSVYCILLPLSMLLTCLNIFFWLIFHFTHYLFSCI